MAYQIEGIDSFVVVGGARGRGEGPESKAARAALAKVDTTGRGQVVALTADDAKGWQKLRVKVGGCLSRWDRKDTKAILGTKSDGSYFVAIVKK